MRWKKFLPRNKKLERRLQISLAGKWFLGFTLLLGIVAINSGNNVIYLLESLLLSALLFSGILSEFTVSRISVRRKMHQATAGRECADTLILENKGWFPLFCVEVGEWDGGEFHSFAFHLRLPSHSSARVSSRQRLGRRGRHQWQHLAVATSFPFGFARKIRFIDDGGSRIVWPRETAGAGGGKRPGDWELAEGELKEVDPWGDLSRVHWISALRLGRPVEKPFARQTGSPELELDLRALGAPQLEEAILRAAAEFYRGSAGSLVLVDEVSRRVASGKNQALDALALLPEGR